MLSYQLVLLIHFIQLCLIHGHLFSEGQAVNRHCIHLLQEATDEKMNFTSMIDLTFTPETYNTVKTLFTQLSFATKFIFKYLLLLSIVVLQHEGRGIVHQVQ